MIAVSVSQLDDLQEANKFRSIKNTFSTIYCLYALFELTIIFYSVPVNPFKNHQFQSHTSVDTFYCLIKANPRFSSENLLTDNTFGKCSI